MGRKVFISFLGATNYGACHYCTGEFDSGEVRFIQEATLHFLSQAGLWTKRDVAYILMTEDSRKKNWLSDGQRDFKAQRIIRQPGLYACLRSRHFPMTIKPVEGLPDGNTEEEVLTIFQRVYALLRDGDELYFDITHGFRYLPMLVLVLGNYSKFLRNVTVKMISYGNYEGRDRKTNNARIMDLTVLSSLQDWTNAAGSLIRHGDAKPIKNLATSKIDPILRNFGHEQFNAARLLNGFVKSLENVTSEMQTCRGRNILNGTNIRKLKEYFPRLQQSIIEPINPIIQRIEESFSPFSADLDIRNGFVAANWCLTHNLYQQAVTIIQETVITFFCMRHNVAITDRKMRTIVNSAINVKVQKLKPNFGNFENHSELSLFKGLLADRKLSNRRFKVAYSTLNQVRNDFNHFGMNPGPNKWSDIQKNIVTVYNELIVALNIK